MIFEAGVLKIIIIHSTISLILIGYKHTHNSLLQLLMTKFGRILCLKRK